MKIENGTDYDRVVEGCCPSMEFSETGCPREYCTAPLLIRCQYKYFQGYMTGFTNPDDSDEDRRGKVYLTKTTTYQSDPDLANLDPPKDPAGKVETLTWNTAVVGTLWQFNPSIPAAESILVTTPIDQDTEVSGGDSTKGPPTIEYSNPVGWDDARADLIAAFEGAFAFDDKVFQERSAMGNLLCESYMSYVPEGSLLSASAYPEIYIKKQRYRYENFNLNAVWYKVEWEDWFMNQDYLDYLFDYEQWFNNFKQPHMNWEAEKEAFDNYQECLDSTPLSAQDQECYPVFLDPGPPPPLPDAPDLPTELPEFIAAHTYEYENGPQFSEWVETQIVDVWEKPGQVQHINHLHQCWRSSKFGNVPDIVGDQYDPDNPVPDFF